MNTFAWHCVYMDVYNIYVCVFVIYLIDFS